MQTADFDFLVECVLHTVSIEETIEGRNVHLFIVDHEKKQWVVTAHKLIDLLLDGMCKINIIHQIKIYDYSTINNQDVLDKVYCMIRERKPDDNENLPWVWDLVEKRIKSVQSAKAIMMEIEEVCGAYVLLIAESVTLSRNFSERLFYG